MKTNKQLVDKLATLARLEFTDDETEKFVHEFDKMIGFIEKMNELDLKDIAPLASVSDVVNNLRPDVVNQIINKEDALLNAPRTNGEFFMVPKVIKKKHE